MEPQDQLRASNARLRQHRDFFAALVTANAGIKGQSELQAAFASVPREHFLGKGPWKVLTASGYVTTPSDEPTFVYSDSAIAIEVEKGINNGQPTLHALCIAALNIKEGEIITHVGAGTGYYTAILAKVTGPKGVVHAFEIDPQLAKRAAQCLANAPNIAVYGRSGTETQLSLSDIVYVSAGATGPQTAWLDALRSGGRLLFPLTGTKYAGAMLLVTKKSALVFEARFLIPAFFIGCAGARDPALEEHLSGAFARGDLKSVQSLRMNSSPDETCWFAGEDWWLSTAPAS
jgi:protein-L-isoaspartate(D-aspartate) O-methyltransferase